MPRTVLIIDDEPDLIRLLQYNLVKADYHVLSAGDGETGLDLARRHAPDLVVLDVMLPGLDGWETCKRLRREPGTAGIPILMLTAKAEESDRVVGLELGADDYVTKPFSVREFLARVKALLRRAESASRPAEVVKAGPFVIDAGRHRVTVSGQQVELTTTEFNILKALAGKPGMVRSREHLIDRARGEDVAVVDRTIDVHIAALRRKLGRHGRQIETVRGVGYRLRE